MQKQLTDDFEFDESKQELKEYDVAASATGTVSDSKFGFRFYVDAVC